MIRIEEALQQVERLYRSVTGRSFETLRNETRTPVDATLAQQTFENRVDQLLHTLQDPAITPQLAPWTPAMSVWESARSLSIRIDLPGVKKENIDISVRNGLLTITGLRQSFREENQGDHRQDEIFQSRVLETRAGHFQRSIVLPLGTIATQVDSHLADGVLEITLPKDGNITGTAEEQKSSLQ